MSLIVKTTVLVVCLLGFAVVGVRLGVSRVVSAESQLSGLEMRVVALEAYAKRAEIESQAKRKLSTLILEMDAKAAAQCKHEGPHFIAEDSQGTFCLDCGAKIKD